MPSRYRREVRLTAAEIAASGQQYADRGVVIVEVDAQGARTGRELRPAAPGVAPVAVSVGSAQRAPASLSGTGAVALTQAAHAGGAWHAEPGQSSLSIAAADWPAGGTIDVVNHSGEPLPVAVGVGFTGYRNRQGEAAVSGPGTLVTLAPLERAIVEIKDGAFVNVAIVGGAASEAGWAAATYYRAGEIVRAPSAQGGIGAGDRIIRATAGKSRAGFDATEAALWSELAEDPDLLAHVARSDNPHATTKAHLGLGSVDNVAAAALRDRATHTGTQALATVSGHDKAAHDALGVNAATVAGATPAQLRDRATHTGTQPVSTLADHSKAVHDALAIDAATVGGALAAQLRDRSTHTGTQPIASVTGHDKPAHDALAIDAATVGASTPAQLRDRSTHTGAQAIASVAGLQAALDARAASTHSHALADVSGLGTGATRNVGTQANEVVALDGSRRLPAVDGSLLTGVISAASLPGATSTSVLDEGLSAGSAAVDRATVSGQTVLRYATVGSSAFVCPAGVTAVWLLVVAGGGGGGGSHAGGGGGAGGVREESALAVTPGQSYAISVGDGGAGGASNAARGTPGSASSFDTVSAAGGGAGAFGDGNGATQVATVGGSGGGGSGYQGGSTGAAGTAGQGNTGGNGSGGGGTWGQGGGGGGAGGSGQAASGTGGAAGARGGNGGAGLSTSIAGAAASYGGGGGGGGWNSAPGGTGGAGGGGSGATSGDGTAGTANTGGGGGGSGAAGATRAGGSGGSGVVIVRYATQSRTYAALGSYATDSAARAAGRLTGDFYRRASDGAVVQVQP